MKNQEIVSWLTVNNYSKLNEYCFFVFCALLVPLVAGFVLSFFSPKGNYHKNITQPVEKNSKLELFLQFILVPVALYFALYKSNLGGMLDLYHEGEMLAPVHMSLNGLLPYKDFYLQHGLIRNYLMPLLAVTLYGETVESVRLLFHQVEPLAYVFLYFVGLKVFRGGLLARALSALLPVIFCSSYHYWIGPRQGLMLLSLFFVLEWLESAKKSSCKILLAGLSSGLCFWFSVDYGIYSIAATIITIVVLFYITKGGLASKRTLVAYLFGLFLVSFPILLWLAGLSVLDDFYKNLYQQIFYQSKVWGSPFPALDLSNSQTLRVYASIPVLSFFALYVSWSVSSFGRKTDKATAMQIALFLFAFFCFRTALGRSDYGHWIDGSTLIFLILFIPFNHSFFRSRLSLKAKSALIVVFLPLIYFLATEHQVFDSLSKRVSRYGYNKKVVHSKSLERLGGLVIPGAQEKTLEKVLEYISVEAGSNKDYIYDFSNQAAYYFLANKVSPTKYFQVSYAATSEMQEIVVSDLMAKKPKLVIFSTGTSYDAIDGISSEIRQAKIFSYIQKHYQPSVVFDATTILKRKP